MGLFSKSKSKTSCCNFQIEDVEKQKPSPSCCNFNIEEVEEEKQSENTKKEESIKEK